MFLVGSGAVLQLFSASNAATPLPEVVPLFASAIPAYGDFMYRNSTGIWLGIWFIASIYD